MKEELAVQSLDGDGNDIFTGNEIEGCVCVIEQRLSFQRFEAYHLESPRAGDTELRSQEVNGGGLGGYVKLLCGMVSTVTLKMRRGHTLNGLSAS